MGIETLSSLSAEFENDFNKLRSETTTYINVALVLIGVLLLAGVPWYADPTWAVLTSFGLFASFWLIWSLRWNFILSALFQILTLLATLVVVLVAGKISASLFLLPILVGLTIILFGNWPGAGMAAATSLVVLFLPSAYIPPISYARIILIVGNWSLFGLLWLVLRPLLITIERAWSGYERSLEFLKQSQDLQVKLFQTLEDLSGANEQLTRLNKVAQSLREIAEKERHAKEQFVANVSHELRTPLNMIIGFCENILQVPESYEKPIPQSLMADMEVVLRNGSQLSSLIDDVLDLSQIDAGQVALSKENSSLKEIVEEAVMAVRPLYKSKNLPLEVEIGADLPAVNCDRARIRGVVLNLLSNAGRFTDRGKVTVKAWQDETSLVVSVQDTGPGISHSDQEQIFRPFKQLELGAQRRFGGTGLGLTISKSFVELHHGTMWVESEQGQGAKFTFKLPIDYLETMSSENVSRWFSPYHLYEKRERPLEFTPSKIAPRLVVVEQGDILEKMLKRYLTGFDIVACPDLETARKDLEEYPAQALLVNDLQMGRAISNLNQLDLPFNIPAICCSIPGVAEANQSFGVREYLVKPISRQVLLNTLENLDVAVKKILIVEDDPDALQLFRRILVTSKRGYQVYRAMNGLQGLEIMRKQPVDVVLLDLVMPEMNGLQLLAEKSRDSRISGVPVILISARDPQGHPIASNAVAVIRYAGLSAPNIMACIEAFISILSPTGLPADPKLPETPSG